MKLEKDKKINPLNSKYCNGCYYSRGLYTSYCSLFARYLHQRKYQKKQIRPQICIKENGK